MTTDAVRRWVADRAVPVPLAPGHPPSVVGTGIGTADVVGLGAAVRHAAGTVVAMRTVLLDLVVHHGFRALALEGTDPLFTTAPDLDRFVVHGDGDPRALLTASQSFLRTREILEVVLALRAHNAEHPADPVRIVHDLTGGGPSSTLAEIERGMAVRALAWRETTGQRIVHWGGAAHVVAGDPRGVSPAGPDPNHRNAGGHLRAALGARYVAVAATVGTVTAGPGLPAVPPVPGSFTESVLDVLTHVAWVPLRDASAPAEVDTWLDAPLRSRMIGPTYDPDHDEDHHVSAPSVRAAVDAVLHVPRSAADTPL